jgi:hypothetical protein
MQNTICLDDCDRRVRACRRAKKPHNLDHSLPELVASLQPFLQMVHIVHRGVKYCIKWEFQGGVAGL